MLKLNENGDLVHVEHEPFEYDGAYRCIRCKSWWGALPGEPEHPPEHCAVEHTAAELRAAGLVRGEVGVSGQYRANFLFPPTNEIEALGYEFANASSEAYQEEVWNDLRAAIAQATKENEHD